MAKIIAKIDFEGKEYSLETGQLAKFASGSVLVRCGETIVLVTAVASNDLKDVDFLPLTVEYREKLSAVGKFPGGFIKREGKPSDNEVLTSRLIDRPIRPMFPDTWHYETQIIATVFSADPDIDPDTLAAVGASAALLISDIPFNEPLSEVRVGKIDDEYVANPSFEDRKKSILDITVAGTDAAILMVEGECNEISEEDFLGALEFAHSKIRLLNDLQKQLASQLQIVKREYPVQEIPEELIKLVKDTLQNDLNEYIHKITSKAERTATRKSMFDAALLKAQETFNDNQELLEKLDGYILQIIDEFEQEMMRKMIIEEKRRLDGRGLRDIRPISCEVGLLPRAHGSALFTRGETQSLCSITLGTQKDSQTINGIDPVYQERFMLHYNFPPFSTGEVGRLMVSRREIGHGHLAWRALKGQLPEENDFPYAIRVISDILESNGSSSMATVCSGSLGLFDAGVPLKKPVAGIAMGLIKENDDIAILSDILGDEDHLGDMDFKVAGTIDGITACQMDIKIEGITIDIMRQALHQANEGRLHILDIMNKTLDKPREDISMYAPRFYKMVIPTEMIGAVIGTGGETIRSITTQTQADIAIEQDGTVTIAAANFDQAQLARQMIESLVRKPQVGEIYSATVKEIRPNLGAIVEFLPRQQGLLHISQISNDRVEDISKYLKVGEKIELKLIEITPDGKFRLSLKAVLNNDDGGVSASHSDSHSSHHSSSSYNKSDRSERRGPDRDNGERVSFRKK
ncbi:polyribonucleotide nucleotidyltransferase [bacterium]|nr:polyribonucleotide nucleotidyltransferase [bacterium]